MSQQISEKNQFEIKLDQMVNRIWDLQYRISELREFEKQWKELFELLENRTGKACKINVLNQHAFRDFRWDKYHILASDLLSLLENELDKENRESLIRLSSDYLVLLSSDSYLDPNYTVNFIDNPSFVMTEDEKKKRLEEMRSRDAERTHGFKKEGLKRLFPKISENFKVTSTDVQHLLSRISSLAKEVRGIRHFFNHKFEDRTRQRYLSEMDKFNLDHLEKVSDQIFDIVTDLGLVFKSSSYGKAEITSATSIEDRIDIILFGSIRSAVHRFYEVAQKNDYYWQAREKYFESDQIFSILAND